MTDKELKKLNRYQLLELLILQTERTDTLQQKLDALEAQMNQQNLKLTALGSSAEASLQLEGVFQAAQNAAKTYRRNRARNPSEGCRHSGTGIGDKARIMFR